MIDLGRIHAAHRDFSARGLEHLRESLLETAAPSRRRLRAMTLLGALSFPVFYFVWTGYKLEAYENLGLRLFGSGLCLLLFFLKPPRRDGRESVYNALFLGTVVFCLPFFFTYMTLRNDFSPVWRNSLLACVFVLFVFSNRSAMLFLTLWGVFLAYAAETARRGRPPALGPALELAPVYIFTIVFALVYSYRSDLVRREKSRAVHHQAAQLAHEMKRPLIGLRAGLEALRRGSSEQLVFQSTLRLMERESENALKLFDILRMNASAEHINPESFRVTTMDAAVRRAVETYPYRSDLERKSVRFFPRGMDFSYHGSDLLSLHVAYNLIKNALASIFKLGSGSLRIYAAPPTGDFHRVVFEDTGGGIPEAELKHVFERFYSSRANAGGGLGLAFVRLVMEAYGGRVSCESRPGKFARFTLYVPGVPGAQMSEKSEISSERERRAR